MNPKNSFLAACLLLPILAYPHLQAERLDPPLPEKKIQLAMIEPTASLVDLCGYFLFPEHYGLEAITRYRIYIDGTEKEHDKPLRLTKGKKHPSVDFYFINGLWNDAKDAIHSAELVSSIFSSEITLYHNNSFSWIKDLARGAYHLSIEQNKSKHVQIITTAFRTWAREDLPRYIVWLAHSEGALITQRALGNLSSKEKSLLSTKMEIYTFGSPSMIPDDNAFNFVAKRDFISHIFGNFSSPNIEIGSAEASSWLADHSFGSEYYQRTLEEIARNYLLY